MNLGDRIKAARKSRGMTQKDLAAASDVSLSTIARCEQGSRGISLSTIDQLALTLGVSTEHLVSEGVSTQQLAGAALTALAVSSELRMKAKEIIYHLHNYGGLGDLPEPIREHLLEQTCFKK